jgi:ATP-dependent RNA helicase DeaD
LTFTTHPALARALAERNYSDLTPVQAAVLAPDTVGRDLLVSAQTGSGKTVAYGLAIADTLLETAQRFEPAEAPLALIVAPTRELALQVQRELSWLYAQTGARLASCVGGMDPRQEQRVLAQGAHIVVGTPGRLRDHLERGRLDLSSLKAVVLDEADEMLDLGFREDLEFILESSPAERRSLLFSATLPRGIAALARRYQREAARIEVAGAEGGHADIEYRLMRIVPREAEQVVVNVLRQVDAPSAIVFCNTRESVRHLHAILEERQFSAVALSGELDQKTRNHALQALRDGRARVCVATDVAARGIDLPNLGLVIHADLPNGGESLQHRSGRTGRAGRKGVSVLLVPPIRRRRAETLLREIGVAPQWSAPPSADAIRALDHERMQRDPMLTEAPDEYDLALGRTLLAAHAAEHLAAALARLYRARLPAPEEVTDPGEARPPRERGPQGRDRYATDRERPAPAGERAPRKHFDGPQGDGVWFSLNVGHSKRADPKWLLPLICRRGNVTRQEIGAIRIFEEQSAFEVAGPAAERFAEAALASAGGDVLIERLPGRPPQRDEGRRKPSGGKPGGGKPAHGKPPFAKRRDARPDDARPRDARPHDAKRAYGKPIDAKRPDARSDDAPRREGKPAHGKPGFRERKAFDKPGGKFEGKGAKQFAGKPKGSARRRP